MKAPTRPSLIGYDARMVRKQTQEDARKPTAAPEGRLCNADRMQRRHCAYYHEKTGRCTQSVGSTWQARAEAVGLSPRSAR
jgi:hypothetical protein